MIKTLVTNREWGKFSHTLVASAVKACLGRTEVAKRLFFISFAVVASFLGQTAHAQNAAWEGSTPSAANGQASKGIEYEINGVVDQVNGDVTAIEGIEAAQQHDANIYNLNGQLVRQGATSTEGLPSGLYIVGGKKVVVK